MHKRFVKGMLIYAIVFLVILAVGLAVLWDFMSAYEQSRPVNTVKAYMAELTPEALCDGSSELLAQVDGTIQSREEACQVIKDSVENGITYAKKSGESSSERQVYVLRSGQQVIGQFAITAGEPDKYGFRIWSLSEESFDFSHLFSEPVSITVPSDFSVSINGNSLDESYITETDILYGVLEAFYGDIPLPTMVTYTADSFLGELTLEVTDRNGDPVAITAETNMDMLLKECTAVQMAELETFTGDFLHSYVTFTGSSNHTAVLNYTYLRKYLISGSALAQRLYTAIDGLSYAQSNGDKICQITMNQYADLGEGRYFCDVTYIVETLGRAGAVQTTNNLRLLILDTEDGLKVEAMTRY